MMELMDLTQPPRYGPGFQFPCQNPECAMAWHVGPYCPYARPPAPSIPTTPSELRSAQQIRRLERQGRLPHIEPLDMRWIWLIPPALVLLFLLMLF